MNVDLIREMEFPVYIVAFGEIRPEVSPAAFFAPEGRARDEPRDGDKMEALPGIGMMNRCRLPWPRVREIGCVEGRHRARKALAGSGEAERPLGDEADAGGLCVPLGVVAARLAEVGLPDVDGLVQKRLEDGEHAALERQVGVEDDLVAQRAIGGAPRSREVMAEAAAIGQLPEEAEDRRRELAAPEAVVEEVVGAGDLSVQGGEAGRV